MARSRSPGRRSSSSAVSAKEALGRLNKIAASKEIQRLKKALGEESKLTLVGGAVRETFKGSANFDLDLATVLPPETVRKKLSRHGIKSYATGLRHGTITAVIEKKNIEITTYRKAAPGGKNAFSDSILDDLKARDFTINAVAYDLFEKKLIDPLKGLRDLKSKLLKSCGEASKRFREDPLRILRLVRFGPAQGFKVDPSTERAALKLSSKLKTVSVERIRLELEKILLSPYPSQALRFMAQRGLLQYVLPEILPSVGFEQNKYHIEDVFEHTLTVLEGTPAELRLRLAALFHDIGKPASLSVGEDGERHFYLHENIGAAICKKAMRRLRFSNEEIKAVSELVRLHMRPIDCGPAGVRRLMRDLGDYFEDWKKLKQADYPPVVPKAEFKRQYNKFLKLVKSEAERLSKTQRKLAINGHDLIALGERPGKRIGQVLKTLEDIVIENPELNAHNILIEKAKELLKQEPGDPFPGKCGDLRCSHE